MATLLILPTAALTVIPRPGAVSVPPPAGVIDKRTPLVAAPGRPLLRPSLGARVEPPQAAASNPSPAQIASDAAQGPRRLRDRKRVTSGIAAWRNSNIGTSSKKAYVAPPARPTLTHLLRK
jgi:hypothetical protein